MSAISNTFNLLTRNASRTGLLLRKASPKLLVVAGAVGVGATIVLASKAAIKAQPILEDLSADLDALDALAKQQNQSVLPDKLRTIGLHGLQLGKVYLPTIAVAAVSVSCFFGAQSILTRRNAALTSTLASVNMAFDKYKKNVEDHLGKFDAIEIQGGEIVEFESTDEKGALVKTRAVDVSDPSMISVYARFFDETSSRWCKTPEYNLLFLHGVQSRMNDKLRTRGHLFLNEVYEELGIPHSQAGQLVGWVYGREDGEGDGYVDFGFHKLDSQRARDFVNGIERSVLLDFNVDGVVYDLI